MNISRKSWHYRFICKFGSRDCSYNLRNNQKQYTTCTYIRDFILAAISITAFITWCLLIATSVISLIVCMCYTSFVYFSAGMTLPVVPTIPLVVGLFGCICVVMGIVAFIVVKLVSLISHILHVISRKTKEKKRREKFLKEDSLLKQAIKDKKDGICTLVRFVD